MKILTTNRFYDEVEMPTEFLIANGLPVHSNAPSHYVHGYDDDPDLLDKIIEYADQHPETNFNFAVFEIPDNASDYIVIRDGDYGDFSTLVYVVYGKLHFMNNW